MSAALPAGQNRTPPRLSTATSASSSTSARSSRGSGRGGAKQPAFWCAHRRSRAPGEPISFLSRARYAAVTQAPDTPVRFRPCGHRTISSRLSARSGPGCRAGSGASGARELHLRRLAPAVPTPHLHRVTAHPADTRREERLQAELAAALRAHQAAEAALQARRRHLPSSAAE